MIYPYLCPACGNREEVYKHHSKAADAEFCNICMTPLKRIWVVPMINTKDRYEGYSPALGCHVSNKADLRDKLHRHKDKTGIELVEMGNEKMKAAPVKSDYNLSAAETKKVSQLLTSVEG